MVYGRYGSPERGFENVQQNLVWLPGWLVDRWMLLLIIGQSRFSDAVLWHKWLRGFRFWKLSSCDILGRCLMNIYEETLDEGLCMGPTLPLSFGMCLFFSNVYY